MKHDNNHRRKTKRSKPNTKRGITEVSTPVTNFNIRGVSGDGKSIIGYLTGREDGWKPYAVLRHIADNIGVAVKRLRKSFQLGYNIRTYEVNHEMMEHQYGLSGSFIHHKLIENGFDINLPVCTKLNQHNLSVIYYQTQRETREQFFRRKIIATWRWFLSH